MHLTDMMSAVLGGLFSISMISIAIFTLIHEDTRKKTLGLSLTSLKRYYVFALFGPLLLIMFEMFLIVLAPNIFNTDLFSIVFAAVVIWYLMFHAIKVLQPYYSPKVFKKALIKVRFKKKKNKNKKSLNEIIDELNNLKNAYTNPKTDTKELLYSINDIKDFWKYYSEELKLFKITKEDSIIIFDIEYSLFGDDFYNMPNGIKIEYYIDYLIDYRLNSLNGYDKKAFDELFNIFHSIVQEQSFYSKTDNNEYHLLDKFLKTIRNSIELLQCLMNQITSKDWNKKDVIYIHYFINILLLKKEEVLKLESIPSKIDYMYKCYENDKNFNESFGRNYDSLLKTCFRLIKEDMTDEK